jgi:hypothetical protein
MVDNNVLIAKAEIGLADLVTGGGLKPDEVEPFIEIAIAPTVLTRMCTVETTGSPTKRIPNLRFNGRVLHAARSGAALPPPQHAKPTLGESEAKPQLFKAEVRIPEEIAEDNIDGPALLEKIRSAAAKAVGKDIEDAVINGDTASTDAFLAAFDGVLKDAVSNTFVVQPIAQLSKDILEDLELTLPAEFFEDPDLVHFTSRRARKNYAASVAERPTVLGDSALVGRNRVFHDGIEVIGVPLFPENLGPQNNETVVLLTNPKNIHVVVHRRITIKTAEDISEGHGKFVMTVRFDQTSEFEGAQAKGVGIRV